jgi:hypothetical protein
MPVAGGAMPSIAGFRLTSRPLESGSQPKPEPATYDIGCFVSFLATRVPTSTSHSSTSAAPPFSA